MDRSLFGQPVGDDMSLKLLVSSLLGEIELTDEMTRDIKDPNFNSLYVNTDVFLIDGDPPPALPEKVEEPAKGFVICLKYGPFSRIDTLKRKPVLSWDQGHVEYLFSQEGVKRTLVPHTVEGEDVNGVMWFMSCPT